LGTSIPAGLQSRISDRVIASPTPSPLRHTTPPIWKLGRMNLSTVIIDGGARLQRQALGDDAADTLMARDH